MMNQLCSLVSEISYNAEPLSQTRIRNGRNGLIRLLAIAFGSILLCVCCLVIATRTGKQILLESEERFHLLADFMPLMACIADKTGRIFWYNQRWYDYTGTTPTNIEGWVWQTVYDPQSLPAVLELWSATIASGQPFQMEMAIRGADGSFRMFLTRVMPCKDKEGNIFRWFGTNTYIHELAQAQEELRRANKDLEVRIKERTEDLVGTNKELESFVYSDLRAPLRQSPPRRKPWVGLLMTLKRGSTS